MITNSLFSQTETTSRELKPFGITVGLGMPGSYVNLSSDFFIIQSLNIEAGLGTKLIGLTNEESTKYANISYHLSTKNNDNVSMFAGLGYVNYKLIHGITGGSKTEHVDGIYMPIGFVHIGESGFTFKIEFGPLYESSKRFYNNELDSKKEELTAYGAFKIGFHFGDNSSSNKNKMKTKSNHQDENPDFHPDLNK